MSNNSETSLVSSKSQLDATKMGSSQSGSSSTQSSFGHFGFLSSSKARACFALLAVNAVLIVGIFVSASERVMSPHEERNSTNSSPNGQIQSENVRLQSVKVDIPADVYNALMKVHKYMESKMATNSTARCQFAWKYKSKESSVDLFICK